MKIVLGFRDNPVGQLVIRMLDLMHQPVIAPR